MTNRDSGGETRADHMAPQDTAPQEGPVASLRDQPIDRVGTALRSPGPKAFALTIVVVAFAMLTGLGAVGVIDYDEAIYADVARRMAESGDYLIPVSGNGEAGELKTLVGTQRSVDPDTLVEPWFEKPPFVYWVQVLGVKLFGSGSPWSVRFFNALAGIGLVVAVGLLSRRPLGARAAWMAVVIVATSIEVIALSKVALTDVWLVLWLFCGISTAARADEEWLQNRRGLSWWLLACAFGGLAVLTKGLIGLVLPGGAFVFHSVLERRLLPFFRLQWLIPGLLVSVGIGASWYFAVGSVHGWGYLEDLFWTQHVGRFGKAIHGHDGPFFYYLPVLIVGLLPWSAFLFLPLRSTVQRAPTLPIPKQSFGDGGELSSTVAGRPSEFGRRFLRLQLTFATLTLLFFSAAATKLPSYVGPVFPTLAVLIASAWVLVESNPSIERWQQRLRRSTRWTAGFLGLLSTLFLSVPFIVPFLPQWLGKAARKQPGVNHLDVTWETIPTAIVLGLGALALWQTSKVRTFHARAVPLIGVTMILFAITGALFVFPVYERAIAGPLRTAGRRAAAEINSTSAEPYIVLVGIKHVPSIPYTTAVETVYASKSEGGMAQQLPLLDAPFVGIVSEGYVDRLERVTPIEELDRFSGWIVFRVASRVPTPTE